MSDTADWDSLRHRVNDDLRRREVAEAAIARVEAVLASFAGRGLLAPGRINFDVPAAGEVLEAVRTALEPPDGCCGTHTTEACENEPCCIICPDWEPTP